MNAMHRDLTRLVRQAEQASQAADNPYRLRFHLTPPTGWMNDPNGLCKWGDWYHIFYQYGPFDPTGGVKFWGHYRSRDLLRWEKLPPMLYPDQPWNVHGAYSGSALVEDDALYLYYTGNVKQSGNHDYIRTGREHNTALAVSRDGVSLESHELLMTNADYPEGLTCHVRDPKVWTQDGQYYMVQGARTLDDRGELLLFTSADKRHWEYRRALTTPEVFGYMWECPDLFCLEGQWFLMCSPQGIASQETRYQNVYSCGYFPVRGDILGEYTLGQYTELDTGFDFYAPQTFTDATRRLLIGWMGMPDAAYQNPTVQHGWQHGLTVPCVLTRRGDALLRTPARELEGLRTHEVAPEDAYCFDLLCSTEAKGRLVIRDSAVVEWETGRLTLSLPQGGAGRTKRHAIIGAVRNLRILADTSSIEIFVNDGAHVLTTRYYPAPDARGVRLEGGGKPAIWEMGAIAIESRENI